jgi:tryptophan synthase alpha chain
MARSDADFGLRLNPDFSELSAAEADGGWQSEPLWGLRDFPFAPVAAFCGDGGCMSRIAQAFERARAQNRAAFVAYLCAGDPNLETSVEACRALLTHGVDILELGVPFSDPLADGLTNQLAAQRALESGMTSARVLELVRKIRTFSEAPIVFYTYYNLVFSNGIDAYVSAAKAAGVDGLLTLDLPPEEGEEVAAACKKHGMDTVLIVAPTTPEARIPKIVRATTGFIYYVSREGVTGVRTEAALNIPEAVERIRRHTSLPVAVGFGISTRAQVAEIAAVADGVVVGSVLVNCIRENLGAPDRIVARLTAVATDLVAGTKR